MISAIVQTLRYSLAFVLISLPALPSASSAQSLSIDSPSVTEGDSGSKNLTFTVTLSAASSQQVTVDWAEGTGGTATSGTDYTAITGGTLTFTAGTTSQTFDVSVTGDETDEPDETIVATLSNASGATISTATGTGTITDDDAEPTLSIDSPSVAEGNSGSKNLTFTVKLSAASGKQVTVDWAEGTGGTATSGTDYTAITGGTLTFPAGTTSQTFDVSVTGDTDEESDETVVATLSNAVNATISAATGTGTIADDDSPHTVSIDSPTVEERNSGSRLLVFTIKLSRAHDQTVFVYIRDAGTGTATPGTDYGSISPQWFGIPAGETERSGSVSVAGDRVKEPDETVVLELVTVWQNLATISTRYGTGTIVDDDTTPGLSISSPRVTEGNSGSATLTYAVTLTAAISEQVTVDYADAGTGTATSGTDYTAIAGGTLTFAANETSKTIAVSVIGDATVEPHETVAVRLSNASGATILTATGTGTIANDDGASSISISSPTLTEGTGGPASRMRFTVTLSSARSQSARVTWWDAGTGTATRGTDYASIETAPGFNWLQFAPGEVSKTFDFAVITDALDEPDETIVMAASESVNGQPRVTGTGTITDDDPTPTLSIDSPSVNEGDSGSATLAWTVSLSAASGREVTVAYASGTGGTATAGTDHTAIAGGTLTFAAGTTSQTFDVSVTGDTDEEPNETVVATLSGATNATISTATGTGTIVNDDGVLISIDSPSVTEGDSGSETLTFTATLNKASAGQVTVDYADAGTGTATSGTDYTAIAGGTLTFAAGTTSQTFDVSVTGDAVDEGAETVVVTLSDASGATISAATGTGTITDNDGAPTLSIDSPSVAEGDNGSTTLTYTVTLSPASGQRVTVGYADTETGTALAGIDYTTIASRFLTFEAGTTSQTIAVSVIGDVLSETDETILVSLSRPTNAVVSSTAGMGTGTITDDDPLPTLSIDSPSANEGNSGSKNLTFTATLSAASGREVTVDWAEGTGGTATSGTDYTAIAGGTLTFAAGTTSQTIDVSVTGDTDDEPYETVVVTLSNAANATISTATGTGTIANDDGHLLSIDSPSVTEGDSGSKNLTFTVTLNTASAERVTVDWADAGTGTAASGTDYTAIAGGTLTFAAGTTSQTIDVSVTGDAADEADETILVTLSNALGATISTATGTGTIADNDPEPSLSINSPSVTEGDSGSKNLTFTVTLSAASGKRVTVDYVDAGIGTATPGTDYTAIADGTLTFEPGDTEETFDVSVTGDGDGETNETILVTLRNATNATISTARGTGTITDDDDAHAVSIDSPTVEERDSGSRMLTFTIKLTRAHEQWVSVYLRDAGTGTATPGTDYTAFVPQWVNIAPGDTESTVSISVTGDRVKEPDETVALDLVTVWENRATISTRYGTGTITDDDTTPGLSISSPRVNEGNSGSATLTYAVTLTAAISEQVTVDYADAGTGTATSGTDYTAITGGTLTFAANETSKTIAVSVTGDATVEPHETVAVRLSAASGATILTATGTGTIANDDGASSISISSPTVVEGTGGPSSRLRFTVTLSSARSQLATIYWSDAGTGTASAGSDYAEVRSSQTLQFEPGEVSKTFDLPVITDSGDEPDETVVIAASESTSGQPRVTGTGTITDDDPTPTLSIDSPSVNEGDSSARMLEWTVSLSAASGREVTVAYASGTGGTATSGTDHTALVAGTLTFTPGDTEKTFGVSVNGDTDEEPNETVVATLSGATNATISTATGTGTIVNDDGVLISIDSPSVTEGDSGSETLTFTATLSTASAGQVTVDYADAGTGTATSGTDYTAIAGGTLTFAAGTTSQTFDVSVTGDAVDEGDETIVVTLSDASGATISAATGTGTITDNDGAPTLSIDSPSVTEGDDGSTTLTYTATLSPASGQRVTVNYADTETGTALAGVDYTTVGGGSLTFEAGTTSQTFDVSVIGDVLSEADETILVSLSGPANAVVSSTAGTGTGTITDDDPLPALSIDSPSVNEGNSGSNTLTYTVTMSPASGRQVTVSYADAGTGTATSGTDYTAITGGTLTFAAGTTSQTFDVSVTGDTDNESYETVVVTLSAASGATIATGTGTGTIANDDGHLLSIDSPSVEEGDSGSKNLTYTVTLSPASSHQVTVAYADALTGTATSGTDYAALDGGTLTFAANETSKTITVSVTGDGSDEESETILVTLSNPVGATISTATGTGTITDNDVAPSLSIGSASVAEGNSGSATLAWTVTLSPASGKQVTVNYADAGTGTATSGTDYTAITGGTLTFAAGTTSQTFDVSVTGDTDDEPNETIVVSLSSPTNATVSSTGGTGAGTIINDDGTPSFSISSPSVIEGNSGSATLTYAVTLLPASAEQLSVRFSDAGTGTATAGTDYAPFRLRWLDFAAGETRKTVSVSVTGDAVKEPNETVVAELYLAPGATGATIGTRYGTGTITDDDATPGLSISSPQVTEGNSGSATLTYEVTLTAAASRQVTVSYADAGTGTATSGTDYTAITAGTLTFAVGTTSQTFDVSVTGDTDVEPHETVVARLSAASGATILTATATGTIVNDDGASTLSVSSPTVTEPAAGGAVPLLRFAVTLGAARSQTAHVYWWDTGTGTATAGSDYGETGVTAPGQRSLTFGAGEVSKTVDISVRDDYGDEPDETVVIAASEAANGQPRVTGTGTIKDNDDPPTFSIDSPTVTEGDAGSATLTYTVRMSGVSGREVTVDYADAGTGTATSGTDYEAIAGGTFTFAPWTLDASATFDVSVTGDTADEPDETILVTLSNPTNATVSTTAGTGTGTITDDDPPAISIDSPMVTEGNTGSTVTLKFKVSLSSASEEQVLVNLADVQSGTATRGTDYNAWGPLSVVFAPGETAWTIDVTVNGDELDEADETILARLSSPTNATIATADGTGTITDDDPSPTLSIDTPTVNEGDTGSATMTYTVTLDPASGQQVTVDYEDAGTGTATSGTDYGAISKGTLTFAAGETSKTFVVSVTGDTMDEVHETVLVSLSNPANATVSSTEGTGTGTITDDDGVPTLSIDSPSVNEGDDGSATLTYTVSLSAESGKRVTVQYADAGTGTADSGTDYTAITGGTLTFAAGTTTQTLDVSVTGDVLDESNETILVSLSAPANAVVSTTAGTGTGTITDDDAAPTSITLTVNDDAVGEGDGATTITVTATVDGTTRFAAATTVSVSVAGSGTATAVDFAAVPSFDIQIAAGEASGSETFTLTPTNDTADETDETITVSGTSGSLTVNSATITLSDDDAAPTLSISSPSVTEGNSGSKNLTFTVSLSPASGKQVTVNYADAGTGTATSGTDYTAITGGSLTFTAGQTSKTFDVSVTGDVLDESNETVLVALSAPANAAVSNTAGTGTGTITDDDAAPSSITLSVNDDAVSEDDGATTITVTATVDGTTRFAAARTVSVSVAASGTASAVDFAAVSSFDIQIATGAASGANTFTLTPTDDTADETDETITVSGTSGSLTVTSATITLSDDDAAPTLSISSPSVTEGNSGSKNLTFTVSLSPASGKQVTVDWAEGTGGTATSGDDYTAITGGSLTFAAGTTSQTFDVSVTGDVLDESNETVVATLSNAANATIGTATGTGTITDDDASPTVTLALSPSAIDESGAANSATVTATLNHASSVQTTVTVSAAPGTNTVAADFAVSANKTLTIAAGSTSSTGTVTITAADNSADDPDKSVTVSGSASNSLGVTGPANVALAIRDDDAAPVLSIDSPTVTEGAGGSTARLRFTVSLSVASGKQVTVNYADAGTGTATSGTDYTAITGATLTFTAGQTSKTIDVSVTGDGMDEPDETVLVALSGPANATVSTSAGTGTGTITDDDATPTVTLALSRTAIDESGTANSTTVTASLNHASSVQTTVTVSAAPGTNTAASDFALSANKTLTIAAGSTSSTGTVTITAADNTADEPDKAVTVSGSASNSQGVTGPADVSLAIRDDDGEPVLSIDSPSVTEGNSGSKTLTFTVSLSPASGRQVTVDWAEGTGGTATSGDDYTAITGGSLTFAAGTTSQTFDVSVTGDVLDESNETVVATLSNAANATIGTATGTGTITDDDATPTTITLSVNDNSVGEGDGATTISVTATVDGTTRFATARTVSVSVAGSGTATAVDFAAVTDFNIQIAAGAASGSESFTLTPTDDTEDETDETITVSGTSSGLTVNSATISLTDDDGAPSSITLSVNDDAVSEDDGATTITVTATVDGTTRFAAARTVSVSVAGSGTASAVDFAAVPSFDIQIAAGEASGSETFTLTPTNDTADETDETITVSGSSGSLTVTSATITLSDDDAAPTLSISSPSVTEGNSGSKNLTFTVSLSPASGKQVTVDWAEGTGGTATSGDDYTAITGGSLTFAAGTTSQTFDISVTGDVLDESNETVVATLRNAANATIGTATGTGTITDDDATPTTITLTVSDNAVGEGDGATTITVTATVDGATRFATAKTVSVSVAGSGTASAVDFAAVSDFDIQIAAGAASGSNTFTLTPTDDTEDETNETITVSGSSSGVTVNSATISLTDDDGAPSSITLSVNDDAVSEDDGATTITVTATVDGATRFAAATTVSVSVAGSGTASAVDFAAVTDFDIQIAAGAASGSETFTLTPTNDTADETDETITVSGTSGSLTVKSATITLSDDDAAPTLSIDSPSVAEGAGGSTATLRFTVSLSPASGKQVTVNYADAGTGTATSGTDYTAITGATLTFAAGQTSKTIDVSVTGDGMDEPDETVLVALSGPANAAVSNTAGTGTGTITDDDATPTVTLALSRTAIDESGTANSATVTASLNHASSVQTTVTVSAAPGTNTAADDFALSSNKTLTIAAGATSSTGTVTITAADNSADDPDKSVTVSGSATNSQGVTGPADVSLAIRDDDAAPVLSIDSPSVAEGAGGSTATLRFTVSLSAASGKQVTVNYADAGTGTATSGTDYTAITGATLTFAAGQTSKTIDVSVTGDGTDEPDETVLVSLSGPANATVSTSAGTGTGTITDDDATPTVTLALSPAAIDESGTTNSATVTASLNHASSVQTTVTVSAAPGTNTAADDFALSSNKTLTFAAGATSSTGTVTITAADNSADDPDKSVTVSGSATNSQGVTDPADVSLSIRDDDAAPVLSIDSPSVAEGAGGSTATLRFTVSLSAASGKQVTVNYADAGTGTATSGTDYTAITGGTLTFAAGQTSKTFDVSVTGDGMDEPDETVLVALSGPANATVSTSAGTGTGTITDDDATPTVTLALSPTAIDESGAANSATVTASLNHASSAQTTVTVSAAPGTNTAADDFSLSANKTLTIAAGSTSSTGTVTITAADNSADDPDKSVTVSGSATNSQGVTDPADVSLAIRDDDAAPVLSIDSPSVAEGAGGSTATLRFTVSLSAASGKQVTVNYADAGTGTATSGTDYTAITGATLTFAAGQTSKTFDVSVTGDGTDEPDETVLVALSGPANATVSTSAGTGTGTITDDDATPTVTLALSPTAIDESGTANSATVTASLNHASSVQTTVTVSAAPGTSTAAADFALSSNKTLTIAAGSTSSTGTVTITAADNSADDPDKSVTVSGSASNSQGVTGPADVSLAIRDDDAAPVLSIDSPSVAEGAGGSTATLRFTVSLSTASGQQVTVDYADDGTGTATSGTDYTAITGATLTFAAGQTSKTIDVSVTGDGMDEPDETVLVALSNPTNATVSSTVGTGTGTITDDDAAPVLSINSPSVTEGNSGTTNLTFTVSLGAASGQQVTVNYADAGTGTATSGTDYTAITGATLTFAAGQTSKTFDVSVTGDGMDEPDETVLVALSNPTNATVSSTAGTGTGTITDDDATPTVTLALSRSAIDESGTANSATVTASLNHASSAQTTVTVSAAPGTNTAAGDYSLSANKTLTIAAGSTSSTGTVTITAADNSADEPDKSVTVSGSASNSQGVTGPADVSLAIRDDDAILSIDSPSVAEGAGGTATLTFTVSLSTASGQQVTVDYEDAGTGTATSGTDYTALSSGTLTFAAGQTSKTISVSVTGDGMDEPNETVLVSLSNPTNATVSSTAGTGTGTITDDDAAPVLSIDSPSVTEGNSGTANLTFTVSLGAASGKQVTVNYADAGTGTATSGTDYTALASGTLTFAAGQTSKTISVSVTGDGTYEPNETVLVALSNPTNATVSTSAGTGTGTITDDDAAPTVTLALSRGTIDESGAENSATVTATLNHASSAQTTVIVSAAPGTNTVAGDYSLSANKTLAIAAGATSSTGTVTITAVDNAAVDPGRSVTVSGSASNSLGVTDPADVSLAIRDDDAATILSIDSPSVTEGNSGSTATLRFAVSLSEASGNQVTVNYADTGTGTATSGTDYVALPSGTLTFAPGETSKTISVAVTGDDLDEPDETVLVSLSGPSNAAVSASAGAGTGTITDDDPQPALSIDSPEVAEGEDGTTATLRFTVSLSAASGRPVTVDYADAGTGTATQGTDYEELADGTLSFAPGDRTGTIDVTVIGDGVYEADETVVLSLSNPTNATVSSTAGTGTGTITDDDRPPAVSLVLTPATINESGAENSATVTATLSHPSSARTTVTVAAAPDNDAVAGSFSPSSNRTLTIPAGGTSSTGEVTITATDNSMDEPDKKVTVSGTAANAQGVTGPPAVTLTILDDDDAPALSIDSPSIAEGGDGTTATLRFTVSLSAASGKRVTVDYADAGTGTATSGTDYETLAGGTLAFAPGDTVETIDVTVIGDGMYEADETVMVSLGSPANATVADGGTGTGTITADDDPPLEPPSFTEPAYAFDLAENQAGPLVLGSVTATDPDGDGQLSYALAEGDGARFEVDASGGMVRYLGPGEDAETTPEAYDLVVRATDGDGLSAEATVVVTVLDVNEGPEVAETIAPKSLEAFGAAAEDDLNSHFTDPDGDALSYAAASSAPGVALAAVSESGRLSIAPQATGVATVTVTATDPGGLEAQQQVRVTVERSRAERSRALKLALAAFGRSLGTETVDAIGGRLAAGEPGRVLGRSHVQVGGRSVGCGGWAGDGACDPESVVRSATGLLGLRLSLPTSGLGPGGGLAGDLAGGSVAQTDIATLLFGENSDRMDIGFGFGGNSGFGSNYAGGGDGTDGGGSNAGGSSAGRRDRGGQPNPGGLTSNPVSSQSLLSESSFQLFFGNGSDEGDSRENGMGGNDSGNGAAASQLRNSSSSGWTLWGQANAGGFEGRPDDGFNLKGQTRSAYLGLDYRFSSGLLLGLAGSRSSFDSDYESATNGSGSVDANMTSLYPYFQWSPTEELGLWGLAGAGRGSANLSELAEDPFRHKLTMGMAALGARQELVGPLALKADAFAVRIWSDDSEEVPGVTANAHRVRLAPELRGSLSVGEALSVRTRLELGGRFDGGDAETGGGAEAGAEVGLAHEPTGITVEARGRMLLAHQAEEFKEWGASVTVRVQPGRNREGLSLSLEPSWGDASNGAQTLWRGDYAALGHKSLFDVPQAAGGGPGWMPARMAMELGWGLALSGGTKITPFGRWRREGMNGHRFEVGTRLAVLGGGSSDTDGDSSARGLRVAVDLFGEHISRGGLRPPERRIGIQGRILFKE